MDCDMRYVVAALLMLGFMNSVRYHLGPAIIEFWPIIITMPQSFTIFGLALDIIGVLFLAFFPLREGGTGFLKLEGPADFTELHPWLRWIGLPAIVSGFLLQIIASLMEISWL